MDTNVNINSNEEKMNAINTMFNSGEIPEDLVEFFNKNYPVLVSRGGVPKELTLSGDGYKAERLITEDDILSLSKETLLYLSKAKKPDFILKSFKSGSLKFFAAKENEVN